MEVQISEIKVACATEAMAGYFSTWFPNLEVIGHENKFPDKIDLLILTGGCDVDPERYGEHPNGSVGWSKERDEIETNILKIAMMRDIKVLGVCRGLQLLNVVFGGTLHQDLGSVGAAHSGSHSLVHIRDNVFSWMSTTNSLHHQAIRSIGDSFTAFILSIEPKTSIIEAIEWNNGRYLGVQYHPEFFGDEKGNKFFSIIKSWVRNEIALKHKQKEAPKPCFAIDIKKDWEKISINTLNTEGEN